MRTVRGAYLFLIIPAILIVMVGMAYSALGFMIPPVGDDLGFINSFRSQNDCWYAFPRYIYRAWIWNNARLADMLNPLGYFYSPLWLQALGNGAMVALMYWFAVKLSLKSVRHNIFYAVLIIFLLTFAIRWDGIWMEYNTFYNYIWSSTLAMGGLLFLFSEHSKSGKWYWWLMLPVCFIAGGMHEALGVPMALSLIMYLFITPFYKESALLRKLSLIAMITGGLFTLSSPASYGRIGSMLQPESPLSIIFGSASLVVILILLGIYLLIFNKSLLYSLIHSPWIVYVGIALVSSGFMLLSGYGGRTGWFAQLFAMIAVFQLLGKLKLSADSRVANICSIILGLIIVLHLWQVVEWQYKLSKETRDVIEEYKESLDGIVYYDYTQDRDMPWYLMRKTHGVPDDDDTYYRYRMRMHYGNDKQLVVLPSAFKPIPESESLPIKTGEFILTDKYPQKFYGDTIVEIFPRIMTIVEGEEYIINKFEYNGKELYLLSKTDRDRGEK